MLLNNVVVVYLINHMQITPNLKWKESNSILVLHYGLRQEDRIEH
jgi:hypothetical protein